MALGVHSSNKCIFLKYSVELAGVVNKPIIQQYWWVDGSSDVGKEHLTESYDAPSALTPDDQQHLCKQFPAPT